MYESWFLCFLFTAENIAQTLRTTVVEWGLPLGISDELPPIVSDNAANMVKAASMLNTSLYFGCFAHTINLAVQTSLKLRSASHLLARIRRIVVFSIEVVLLQLFSRRKQNCWS